MNLETNVKIGFLGLSEKEIIKFTKIFQITRTDKRSYCMEKDIDNKKVDIVIVNTLLSSANAQYKVFCSNNPEVALVTLGPTQTSHHIAGMLLASRVYKVLDEIDLSQSHTKKHQSPVEGGFRQPIAQVITPKLVEPKSEKIASTPTAEKTTSKDLLQTTEAKEAEFQIVQATTPKIVEPKSEIIADTGIAEKIPPKDSLQTPETKEVEFQILVVDDSELMQKSVLVELEKVDRVLNVEFALSGEKSLEMINEKRYDLVFMDVMMPLPGIDGFEACTAIRKKPEMKRTPIIMLTSKTSPLDEVKGIMSGCTTYLTKPIKPDEFLAMMKRVLGWLDEASKKEKNSL